MARFSVMLTVILPLFLAACGGGTHTRIAETFPPGSPPPGTTQPPPVTEAQPPPVTEAQPPPVTEAQPPPVTEAQPPPVTEAQPPPVTEAQPPPVTEAQPPPVTDPQPPPVTEAQPPPDNGAPPPPDNGAPPPPDNGAPPPPDNEALRYAALLRVLETNGGTTQGLGTGLTVDQGHVTATDGLGAFDEHQMDFNEGGLDSHVVWESYVSTRASTTVVSVTRLSAFSTTTDYVDFGYWMNEHVAPDNLITTEVGLYSSRNNTTFPVTELGGRVRYLGAATGLYVDIRDQSHGRFFAAVDLTAYFNIEETDDRRRSISGRLYDFRNEDGRMGSDWAVELNKIGGNSGGVFDAAAGTFSGGTTTGGGAWQGAFYPPGSSDRSPEITPDYDRPEHISGTFNAHTEGVGHVAGAWSGEISSASRYVSPPN